MSSLVYNTKTISNLLISKAFHFLTKPFMTHIGVLYNKVQYPLFDAVILPGYIAKLICLYTETSTQIVSTASYQACNHTVISGQSGQYPPSKLLPRPGLVTHAKIGPGIEGRQQQDLLWDTGNGANKTKILMVQLKVWNFIWYIQLLIQNHDVKLLIFLVQKIISDIWWIKVYWVEDYFKYLFKQFVICMELIKNNAWVTVNNDFWSRVRWCANYFHECRSHEWKPLANHLTSD